MAGTAVESEGNSNPQTLRRTTVFVQKECQGTIWIVFFPIPRYCVGIRLPAVVNCRT